LAVPDILILSVKGMQTYLNAPVHVDNVDAKAISPGRGEGQSGEDGISKRAVGLERMYRRGRFAPKQVCSWRGEDTASVFVHQ
jgi:hypothetical protein